MTEPEAQPSAAWAPPSQPAVVQRPTLPPAAPPRAEQPAATQSAGAPGPLGSSWVGSAIPTAPMMQMAPGGAPPSAPKRSRGKTIAALAGVGALVAAGAFAVVTISGSDDKGGAASPTEVGTALTTALDNEDLLGVIDLLLPGEREAFREPIIQTFDNLRRLEIIADDASLNDIGGVDIQFTDVTVDEAPTNVDDIVNIGLSGSATVSVNGDEVPLGSLIIDEAFGGDRPDMDSRETTEEFADVPLTVVERDGRWYLSAFYTAAEQARSETDFDVPERGVDPAGADAPEAAVGDMLEALSDQNLEAMIALLDPDEAEALQRYAPLFLDEAQDALDEAGIVWSITDTAFTVEGSGSRRFVAVDAVSFTATDGSSEVSADYAAGCLTVIIDGDDTKVCPSDVANIDTFLDDAGIEASSSVRVLVKTILDAFEDYDPSGIAVHEVGGAWYLSPIRTYATSGNDALDALDSTEVRKLIDAFEAVGDEMFDVLGLFDEFVPTVGISDTAEEVVPSDTLPVDPATIESLPADVFDTVPLDTDEANFDALTECYSAVDAAAGVACMQEGIAARTIDPTYVTLPLRYPECGVAEVYWGDVYTLPDAEFAAMAQNASQCFLDLVTSGAVESWELPNELLAPECLEGKNWYSIDDEAYFDRYLECVSDKRIELGF